MIRDILDVATSSMRPRWVGRTKPMTDDEICVLMLALAEDGQPLRYKTVYGIFRERGLNILNRLKAQGALDHPRYNDWRITERGRIAAALALHKNPALAAALEPEKAR